MAVAASAIAEPGVSWLAASREPLIRYRALVDLAGLPEDDVAVVEARSAAASGPLVAGLLDGLNASGGPHPYAKWAGTHWRLTSLMDLGLPPQTPGLQAALEPVFGWLLGKSHRDNIPTIRGLTRRCASQEGNALAVAVHVGLAVDPRAQLLAESLIDWQWPDGGWNCDRHPAAHHSSFNEALPALRGIAAFARVTGDRDAARTADRAAEFFLRHRVLYSERTGEPANPRVALLHYPPYWHFDVLGGLRVLAESGRIGDRRASDALDLLESKRRADGTWASEAAYFGRPGAKGSNVDVVDWGRVGAPNEPLTLSALLVLRAAGRLSI